VKRGASSARDAFAFAGVLLERAQHELNAIRESRAWGSEFADTFSGTVADAIGPRVHTAEDAVREARGVLAVLGAGGGPGWSYRYETARSTLRDALADLRVLAGDEVGSGAGWQERATACASRLRALAALLDAAVHGRVVNGPVVFPSPEDCGAD
jgi:hypothetical protein